MIESVENTSRNDEGEITSKAWYVPGTVDLHREGDKPAFIRYEDGRIVSKSWWINGKRHRENGPAYVSGHLVKEDVDNPNDEIHHEEWWLDDKRYYLPSEYEAELAKRKATHRNDVIDRIVNESINKPFHRWDYGDPPSKTYTNSYSIYDAEMSWLDDNSVPHRDVGPAIVKFGKGGNEFYRYYDHGVLTNEDGPAVIIYDKYGNLLQEIYYIDGEEMSKDEFVKRHRKKVINKMIDEKKEVHIPKFEDEEEWMELMESLPIGKWDPADAKKEITPDITSKSDLVEYYTKRWAERKKAEKEARTVPGSIANVAAAQTIAPEESQKTEQNDVQDPEEETPYRFTRKFISNMPSTPPRIPKGPSHV